MILFKSASKLSSVILNLKKTKTTGFVPTMGAIHEGHLSLVTKARELNDVVIASIFVNPTQFNNPSDFQNYPITIEKDIDMLEEGGCDILFLPNHSEIYPPGYKAPHYELGEIESILEGKYRPGHFQGVCQVVDRLLQIINPDNIYLGKKDFQQCIVIKKLISITGSSAEVVLCDTLREEGGLAMSSRNLRLSNAERETAREISKELNYIKRRIKLEPISELIKNTSSNLENMGFIVDYVSIADADTLLPVSVWNGKTQLVALIAATINKVRLIDNLILTEEKL